MSQGPEGTSPNPETSQPHKLSRMAAKIGRFITRRGARQSAGESAETPEELTIEAAKGDAKGLNVDVLRVIDTASRITHEPGKRGRQDADISARGPRGEHGWAVDLLAGGVSGGAQSRFDKNPDDPADRYANLPTYAMHGQQREVKGVFLRGYVDKDGQARSEVQLRFKRDPGHANNLDELNMSVSSNGFPDRMRIDGQGQFKDQMPVEPSAANLVSFTEFMTNLSGAVEESAKMSSQVQGDLSAISKGTLPTSGPK